jgi:hypothetical protein
MHGGTRCRAVVGGEGDGVATAKIGATEDLRVRKRWYVLAVAAGGLLGGAVWLWPVKALWRSPPQAGFPRGFSPDGRIVVTRLVPSQRHLSPDLSVMRLVPAQRHLPPVVSRWDTETGKLLSKAYMQCEHPTRIKEVRPSPDGRLALVGEGFNSDPTREDFESGEWFLHDGMTGKRFAGPIPDVSFVPVEPFSPDGRFFWAMRDPEAWPRPSSIHSGATGELLFALPDRDRLEGVAFAPDGETVAVLWLSKDEAAHLVRIIELPSGKERRKLQLPQRDWVMLGKWDGRQFEAVAFEASEVRWFTFDLAQDVVEGVEDPLRKESMDKGEPNVWIAGESWVAYVTPVPPPEPPDNPGWWERLTTWMGARPALAQSPQLSVRLADRLTGETRYELLQPSGPCFITADGRRLACAAENEAVEVWDLDPPPRWPRALAAGAVIALAVLALGRWRGTRRKPVSSAASANTPQ